MEVLFLQNRIEEKTSLNLKEVGQNYGNLLFYQATLDILKNHNIHFFDHTSQTSECENPDIVVVTLANNIINHLPCINMLAYYADILSRYNCKKILLSIGAQHDNLDYFHLENNNIEIINKFFLEFDFINLRGKYTKELLIYNNIVHDYHVLGCPSVYLCQPIKSNNLHLNLNCKILFNAPSSGQILKYKHCNFMKKLINDSSIDFLFQDSRTKTTKNILIPKNYEHWKKKVVNYDFVIGTRIHGTIMALINKIPSLLLVIDSRTFELAEKFKIPCINLIDKPRNLNTKEDVINLINEIDLDFSSYNNYLQIYKDKLNSELIEKFNL